MARKTARKSARIGAREAADLGRALWDNARDSIQHALNHLAEGRADRRHNTKWALISAHHAAECFANILILEHAPEHVGREGNSEWLPSLARSLKILEGSHDPASLEGAEKRLLLLFRELVPLRHQLAHRGLPPDLEASLAGMVTLGLLRIAERRGGSIEPNERRYLMQLREDAFSAIGYKRVEEYCRLAEELLHVERGTEGLAWCVACETLSVENFVCEVCFEPTSGRECPECGAEVAVPRGMEQAAPGDPVSCPSCWAAVPGS